jgi:hypothetical protein
MLATIPCTAAADPASTKKTRIPAAAGVLRSENPYGLLAVESRGRVYTVPCVVANSNASTEEVSVYTGRRTVLVGGAE